MRRIYVPLAACVVLFAACILGMPAVAPAHAQTNEQSPTMQETMDFIIQHTVPQLMDTCEVSGQLNAPGAIGRAAKYQERDVDKIELLPDGKTMRMTYRYGRGLGHDEAHQLTSHVVDFHLADLDAASSVVEHDEWASSCESYAKIFDNADFDVHYHVDSSSASPGWTLSAKFGPEGYAIFPIESQSMGQRIEKALEHAKLLAGGKPEPF